MTDGLVQQEVQANQVITNINARACHVEINNHFVADLFVNALAKDATDVLVTSTEWQAAFAAPATTEHPSSTPSQSRSDVIAVVIVIVATVAMIALLVWWLT